MKSPAQAGPVRLGIVGVGAMGGYHARTVLGGTIPDCELAAVCDVDPARLAAFEGLPAFTSHRELFRSGLIDAVLIATPHYSHTTIGIAALKAGLHVLVEKPISVHVADALRLLRAHTDPCQVFAAMFNQRTDPAFRKVREMVQGGELGAIRRIQWTITDWFRSQAYYDSGGWRATWAGEGGGVLLNQAVHNLDLLHWIFGPPARVRALCRFGAHHDIEVEDDVSALLEYPDGTTGVFVTSTGEAPGINRLEISGERGRLTLENKKLTFLRNEMETRAYSDTSHEGYRPPDFWRIEIPVDRIRPPGGQHAATLRNFVNAILRGEPLVAPAEEGLGSVELINAILLSAFEDRTVQLPVSPSCYAAFLRRRVAESRGKKRVVPYRGSAGNYLV
jgi:Predicted dehydrogenases and related proteins